MTNIKFLKALAIAFVALFIVSCDKDYNSIGSDVVGNEHFLFEKYAGPLTVKSFNQPIGPVQTNGLYIHQLGVVDNPIFGKTKNNFVTQLTLSDLEPEIHSGVVIDSVVLTVPYFSAKLSTDSNGWGKYELDSIYTSNVNEQTFDPINLKVYRNGYTLNDYNPNEDFATAKKYYSDDNSKFLNNIVGGVSNVLNNDSDVKQNSQFVPDKREYVKFKVDDNFNMLPNTHANVESRSAPRMRLKLDKDYFKTNILDAAKNTATKFNFLNNSNFKAYFKGLYFQVDQVGSNYTSMMLDFAKGNITIYYKQHKTDNDTSSNPVMEMKELVLNMSGQMVNLFDVSGNTSLPSGDSNIYLKGGQGSVAFIELFSGTELQELRDKKVFINDASLYFTVDSSLGSSYNHPLRIYLFDANNDRVLYDYSVDVTTNSANTKKNKIIFGGNLYKDELGNRKYRVRITDHIRRILSSSDSDYQKENVRLGLVVTENINNVSNLTLKNKITLPALPSGVVKEFEKIPSSSVVSPQGTVLYGTNSSLPSDKKVQFEIYYTKPN